MAVNHETWMYRALELAGNGMNSSAPNPRVGCLLVKDGQLVGQGWHRAAGQPHAESNALAEAGPAARGATAYITLEPCVHQGRTPPCCQALISSGIVTAVVAMKDPNPLVSGHGIDSLRRAGVEVIEGVLSEQAERLNAGFCKRMQRGMPLVIAKLAMSLDGRIAMTSGESRWITCRASRTAGHSLRHRVCAVMTGIGTVLQDDPQINSRKIQGERITDEPTERQPLRVIADSGLKLPATARVFDQQGEIVVATCSDDSKYPRPVTLLKLPDAETPQRVDLRSLLKWLAAERECNEVLLEAGGRLNAAMLRAGLIDEMHLFVAPKFLGSSAQPVLQLSIQQLSEQYRVEFIEHKRCGTDLYLIAAVN